MRVKELCVSPLRAREPRARSQLLGCKRWRAALSASAPSLPAPFPAGPLHWKAAARRSAAPHTRVPGEEDSPLRAARGAGGVAAGCTAGHVWVGAAVRPRGPQQVEREPGSGVGVGPAGTHALAGGLEEAAGAEELAAHGVAVVQEQQQDEDGHDEHGRGHRCRRWDKEGTRVSRAGQGLPAAAPLPPLRFWAQNHLGNKPQTPALPATQPQDAKSPACPPTPLTVGSGARPRAQGAQPQFCTHSSGGRHLPGSSSCRSPAGAAQHRVRPPALFPAPLPHSQHRSQPHSQSHSPTPSPIPLLPVHSSVPSSIPSLFPDHYPIPYPIPLSPALFPHSQPHYPTPSPFLSPRLRPQPHYPIPIPVPPFLAPLPPSPSPRCSLAAMTMASTLPSMAAPPSPGCAIPPLSPAGPARPPRGGARPCPKPRTGPGPAPRPPPLAAPRPPPPPIGRWRHQGAGPVVAMETRPAGLGPPGRVGGGQPQLIN